MTSHPAAYANFRPLQSIECEDDTHDDCPEIWDAILTPGRAYYCDCSCHD